MAMYSQIFSVIAPILFISLLGYFWSVFKLPYDGKFISSIVMNVGTPCLIVATMASAHVDKQQILHIGMLTIVGLLLLGFFSIILLQLTHFSWRTYVPSLVFANTGNMGIPIAFFAFGAEGMALSLVYFMVTSLFHFSVGVAIVGGRHPLETLVKSPVFYATAIALLIVFTDSQIPKSVFDSMKLLGDMAIPLMIFSLGVSLHSLQLGDINKSVFFALMRLIIGAAVGLLICEWFDLSGVVKGVVLIQAAMPSAVFNYLLALTYHQQEEAVAGVVVFSTLISFVTLPIALWFIMGG